ncbi:MAG TPA: SAM-dependent methyltransferase [Streptosporangiaceae bacterium]
MNTSLAPSRTALMAAAARAAHLIVDDPPFIFEDTAAAALLGDVADDLIRYHREHGGHPVLACARAQVVCRSRYTEDRLAEAAARGASQYVLLGAGLDTFGIRSALGREFRIFEVDHPATQGWKRQALAAARISVPPQVTFVPAELGVGSLIAALQAAGFDLTAPAVVGWLGVTMYLDISAISATLAALSACAPGTEVIVDYMLPAGLRDQTADDYVSQVSQAAADGGEPWRSFLAPEQVQALLGEHGFAVVEHVRQRDAVPGRLWERSDPIRPADLSMITRAARKQRPPG